MKILQVTVKPKAKKTAVKELPDGSLVVWVTAAPDKGKANAAVIKALARHFNIPPSKLILKSGAISPHKLIQML